MAAAGGDVSFIARGAQLAALQSNGLMIEKSAGGDVRVPEVRATDDPGSIGPVDIVLFAVKLYDTESALDSLTPLIGPATLVVPLQNGVESIERLSAAVGRSHVAGGTAYVTACGGGARPGSPQCDGSDDFRSRRRTAEPCARRTSEAWTPRRFRCDIE